MTAATDFRKLPSVPGLLPLLLFLCPVLQSWSENSLKEIGKGQRSALGLPVLHT